MEFVKQLNTKCYELDVEKFLRSKGITQIMHCVRSSVSVRNVLSTVWNFRNPSDDWGTWYLAVSVKKPIILQFFKNEKGDIVSDSNLIDYLDGKTVRFE